MKFPKEFLLGASTAAHQVEGNNRYSDLWAQEQMEHSSFAEPSNDAVDHYHRYEEDIALMAGAGLNAYRFSIEWHVWSRRRAALTSPSWSITAR